MQATCDAESCTSSARNSGLTQPGKTIVCGDSHTSTHGAFGALAFGIGTTEVGYVLATQCLLQRRPQHARASTISGRLPPGVTAKDLILALIGRIGVNGGTGHVIEYRGPAIEALSMDERMTICNMSIEAGARAGMIAPDETTFSYLRGRPRAPQGEAWERAVADWRTLRTDAGAASTAGRRMDAAAVEPMITYGTNPGMVVADRAAACRIGRAMPVFAKSLALHGARSGRAPARQARSTWCSSAAARTRACPICELAARVLAGRKVAPRRACARRAGLAADQARSRGARDRARCSSTRAPSGASPAARCASA